MNVTARLRVVPTIAYEPDEGRLRRQAGEAGLSTVPGATDGGPHHTWGSEIYDLQMMARVAVTLAEEVFRNLKALEDIHEFPFRDHVGLDELTHQIFQIKGAAEALQEN